MKERYYGIINKLARARADPSLSNRAAQVYDAEHERKRKEQLLRLFNRTQEQVGVVTSSEGIASSLDESYIN